MKVSRVVLKVQTFKNDLWNLKGPQKLDLPNLAYFRFPDSFNNFEKRPFGPKRTFSFYIWNSWNLTTDEKKLDIFRDSIFCNNVFLTPEVVFETSFIELFYYNFVRLRHAVGFWSSKKANLLKLIKFIISSSTTLLVFLNFDNLNIFL